MRPSISVEMLVYHNIIMGDAELKWTARRSFSSWTALSATFYFRYVQNRNLNLLIFVVVHIQSYFPRLIKTVRYESRMRTNTVRLNRTQSIKKDYMLYTDILCFSNNDTRCTDWWDLVISDHIVGSLPTDHLSDAGLSEENGCCCRSANHLDCQLLVGVSNFHIPLVGSPFADRTAAGIGGLLLRELAYPAREGALFTGHHHCAVRRADPDRFDRARKNLPPTASPSHNDGCYV